MTSKPPPSITDRLTLRIAGVTLRAVSVDPAMKVSLPAGMQAFAAPGGVPDFTAEAFWGDLSRKKGSGRVIFDSGPTWRLHENGEDYRFFFHSKTLGSTPYKLAEVRRDFAAARVSVHRPFFEGRRPIYPLEYPLDELLLIHLLAQGRGVEVHACGLIDSLGRGRLFLGQSGAGKSTLARLWQGEPGVTVLSDDRIVLRKIDGALTIFGTPWHGEGRVSSPSQAPLTGVYFLEKGAENRLRPLKRAESLGRFTACSFLPFYHRQALDFTLGFFEEVVETVPSSELQFAADKRVVELIHGMAG